MQALRVLFRGYRRSDEGGESETVTGRQAGSWVAMFVSESCFIVIMC